MTKFPNEKDLKKVRDLLEKSPATRLLPKNAPPVDRAKHTICQEIVKFKNLHGLSQRDLAEKMGIDEALVSKLVHYQLDEFTTDRLIRYVNQLYEHVEVKISVA